MTEFEEKVVKKLKEVKDPETNVSIIDEGLIYGFTIKDDTIKVFVSIEAATPSCNCSKALSWIIFDKITENIVKKLKELSFKEVVVVEELNPKIIYKIG